MTRKKARKNPAPPAKPTEQVSDTVKWFDAIANGEFRDKLKNAIVHPSDSEFRAIRGIFYYLYQYWKYGKAAEIDHPNDKNKQHWAYRVERQCMRDAVDWQKLSGFIEDYDLTNQRLKFRGVWYVLEDLPEQYHGPKFIQTGPAVNVT